MATDIDRNSSSVSSSLCCPTCGAEQPWAVQCRRCRCDLTELYENRTHWLRMRQQCLKHLASAQFDLALRWARLCCRLVPGDESRRLLAVCYLQMEDWPAAINVVRRALADHRS